MKSIVMDGLRREGGCVFACGADIKNRFSFFVDGQLYLSGDNGDLAEPDNLGRYLRSIRETAKELGVSPDVIAHDLHPAYYSSRARDLFGGTRAIGVQHHHAHIASALASSGRGETAIGVAFDGTGFGTDGNIWGGEFLVVGPREWSRCGHFRYLKMPGGEKAVREPWRMAFALLYDHIGEGVLEKDLPFLRASPREACLFVKKMIDRNINAPLTSSCGRLFDAVSSLLGITQVVRFEAEAAVNLERMASGVEDSGHYVFDIISGEDGYVVEYGSFLDGMIADLERGVPVEILARRFHNSLAKLIAAMSKKISGARGLRTVVLSGGVFQNRLLRSLASRLLKEEGYLLCESADLPVNDLGICIGQTYIALHAAR